MLISRHEVIFTVGDPYLALADIARVVEYHRSRMRTLQSDGGMDVASFS